MDPILAQRVKWYQDRKFNPAAPRWRKKLSQRQVRNLIMLAMLLGLILWALATA